MIWPLILISFGHAKSKTLSPLRDENTAKITDFFDNQWQGNYGGFRLSQ